MFSIAASEAEALDRFAEFSGTWEKRYPAIIRLWENAWAEFVPFLAFAGAPRCGSPLAKDGSVCGRSAGAVCKFVVEKRRTPTKEGR